MIISVEKLKEYITTDKTDSVLEAKLQALELLIRKYTNNNFQKRTIRSIADIIGATLIFDSDSPFNVGDTIQISNSLYNEGIFNVTSVNGSIVLTKEPLIDEDGVMVTKVEYPADVIMGVVNMLEWDLNNRNKVGVQSETLSRHSVTYFNMDGDNSIIGYPKSLVGFLKPYMKARF